MGHITTDAFIQSRAIFDKYLKQCQRIYRKNTINELNDVCIDDPRRFWEHIKKLGPRKSSSIPMTVKTVNGLSNDTNTILGEWKTEFENLYKPPDISFDATFARTAKTFVESSESNMERND